MEYLATDFIVMFSIGILKWLVAITLVFFSFALSIALLATLWNVIFPPGPEAELELEAIKELIRERA